jgi:hypothetical protein
MSVKIRGAGKLRALMYELKKNETEVRRNIWQRWKNPTGHTTPVFLIGNVRSGTSMIVFHLAKSWQVKLYNEDNPDAFLYWRLRDYPVIDNLLKESYAPVTLFKPILDTYRILSLLERYPTAKVLFAFRHFDDVINSTRQRFYNKYGLYTPSKKVPNHDTRDPITLWVANDFAEFSQAPIPDETKRIIKEKWHSSLNLDSNIALRWLFVNRLYFDLNLFQDERVKIVHYESAVAEPEREFKDIFQFLDLKYEPHVIEGVFSSSIGKNAPPQIDPTIREDCEELLERLLQQK